MASVSSTTAASFNVSDLPQRKQHVPLRVLAIIFLIGGLIVAHLALNGKLNIDTFKALGTKSALIKMGIALGSIVSLSVFLKAASKGDITGDGHWKDVNISWNKKVKEKVVVGEKKLSFFGEDETSLEFSGKKIGERFEVINKSPQGSEKLYVESHTFESDGAFSLFRTAEDSNPAYSVSLHGDSATTTAFLENEAILDTSTLDDAGNGFCFAYVKKECDNHIAVSLMVTLVTPLYTVATMIYNALRAIIAPIYVLGAKLCGHGEFRWIDIPKEFFRSIYRVAIAPIMAVAFLLATLYSFVDPMNGRKAGSYIERLWNRGVPKWQGYWSVGGPQTGWQFEGGGKAATFGDNGFYLAGCWQPPLLVECGGWRVVNAGSSSGRYRARVAGPKGKKRAPASHPKGKLQLGKRGVFITS